MKDQLEFFRQEIMEQNEHFTYRKMADFSGITFNAFWNFICDNNEISICTYHNIRNWLATRGCEFEDLLPLDEFMHAYHAARALYKHLDNQIEITSGDNVCCLTKVLDACKIIDLREDIKDVGIH
jgi:hypothetical protein